jgi:hypothetical protein
MKNKKGKFGFNATGTFKCDKKDKLTREANFQIAVVLKI